VGRSDRTPPTQQEYEAWRERFSNWNRWGEGDELGTLHHITPERRAVAAALVREGRSVSVARPIDTKPSAVNPHPAHHFIAMEGAGGIADYIGLFFHGFAQTHLDALNHIAVPGQPGEFFAHATGSIDQWRSGIVTRGVLYDIPRLRGAPFVAAGEPVQSWELDDAAAAQGVTPGPGDAVLIRCGREAYFAATSVEANFSTGHGRGAAAGVHCSVLEFLYDTDAALLCWDMLDAPTADQGLPNPSPRETPVHIHALAIPYMGLPLLDNAHFDELAAVCAELGRWEFLFVVSPLVIPGGTGSPVNPLAIL
jgi:hypothetical protein